MIHFESNSDDIRIALNENKDYMRFIGGSPNMTFPIKVENGNILICHQNDDTYITVLLTSDLYKFRDHCDDISRIAYYIQLFANEDYRRIKEAR